MKPVLIGGPERVAESDDVINILLPRGERPPEMLFVRHIPPLAINALLKKARRPQLREQIYVYALSRVVGGTAFYEYSHTKTV